MKVWSGYGSEHSMNLVMIGHFKNESGAKKVKRLIDTLAKELEGKIEFESSSRRFNEDVAEVLRRLNCFGLSPHELENFLFDFRAKVDGSKLVITTEEEEVSAFLKLMVENEAKVEVFSAHYHQYESE